MPFLGGSLTGDEWIDHYTSRANAAGVNSTPAGPGFGEMPSEFDAYRMLFQVPDPELGPAPGIRGATYIDRILRQSARATQPPPGAAAPGQPREEYIGDQARAKREHDTARAKISERGQLRKKLEELAKKAGLIGDEFLQSELEAIWQAAVDEAEASSVMGQMVDPWDILEFWSKDPVRARQYAPAGPSAPDLDELIPPEDRTVTSKNTHVDLTDPETAKVVIRQGLQSSLGRAPTEQEIEQFRQYLNDLERANPTITESTTTYAGDGSGTTTETVTEGGAPSAAAAMENWIFDEHSDEAFAYRMGTEGLSVMQQLVGSLV